MSKSQALMTNDQLSPNYQLSHSELGFFWSLGLGAFEASGV